MASNVLGHLPSAPFSFAAIAPASSAGWGIRRPNGLSDWHAMQGRGSALCMQYDLRVPAVYPPSMVARYSYRCVHAPQTVIWVIQDPFAVSAWLASRLYYLSAS